MGLDTLRKLLEQQRDRAPEEIFETTRHLGEWKRQVEQLYERIVGALSQLTEEGLLTVTRTTTTIRESFVGLYEMPALRFETPLCVDVTLEPFAYFVPGHPGRLYLHCGVRYYTFVPINGEWHVKETGADDPFVPFEEERFADILAKVIEQESVVPEALRRYQSKAS